VAGAWR